MAIQAISHGDSGEPKIVILSTKVWGREFVWTNSIVNLCFLALCFLLQINAVILIRRLTYESISSGSIIFLLVLVVEFCLVLQPPRLIMWIPFWNNLFGRGIFLVILSVMAMNGIFFLGLVALCASLVITCSPICSGTVDVPPPFLSYDSIFIRGERITGSYERIPETP